MLLILPKKVLVLVGKVNSNFSIMAATINCIWYLSKWRKSFLFLLSQKEIFFKVFDIRIINLLVDYERTSNANGLHACRQFKINSTRNWHAILLYLDGSPLWNSQTWFSNSKFQWGHSKAFFYTCRHFMTNYFNQYISNCFFYVFCCFSSYCFYFQRSPEAAIVSKTEWKHVNGLIVI